MHARIPNQKFMVMVETSTFGFHVVEMSVAENVPA